MMNSDFDRLMRAAIAGEMSRRELLERGLKLGLSAAAITALIAQVPEASAA